MNLSPLTILLPCLLYTPNLFAQSIERVSVNSDGQEVNDDNIIQSSSISADGRFITFASFATDLVPNDLNGHSDVFLRDIDNGLTTIISVNSAGAYGNSASLAPNISADGRFITFHSDSTNLVQGDHNLLCDVFVHEIETGLTTCISLDSAGYTANNESTNATLSADGRYVAYVSLASNLVPNDVNWNKDVFVCDRKTKSTTRISVNSSGGEGNSFSDSPCMSADGRLIAFRSYSSDLTEDDENRATDIFLHNQITAETSRISVDTDGLESDGDSHAPFLSADGNWVAFASVATNLVVGDANGKSDIFVHELATSETTRVSISSTGAEGTKESSSPTLSAAGRYVAFASHAGNLVTSDFNLVEDVFLHDRETGMTNRESLDRFGVEGNFDSNQPIITASGKIIAFMSKADSFLEADNNGKIDVYLRRRTTGASLNTIVLIAPFLSPVDERIHISWVGAPPDSKYWLVYSRNLNGMELDGHPFDVGYPATLIVRDFHDSTGAGNHTTPPIPSASVGFTFYLELAAQDSSGQLYDSIVQPITFF